ncbi:MAG: DUF4136 domain-containing protein [Verrucomicrobiota bacterium]
MNISKLSSLAIVVLTICSCSPTIEKAKGTSRGYQSARFVETKRPDRMASATALEDDPAFNAAVKNAIKRQFDANKVPVTGGSADLIIAYMLLRQNTVATTMNNDYFGNGRDPMAILEEAHKRGVINNKRPDDFLRGAILIDVLDARTNKLVFRNYAVRPVTGGVDAATRQARIDSTVSQALAPFFK